MHNLANEMAMDKKYQKCEEIEEPFRIARKWENLHSSVTPFNIELPGLEVINIRKLQRHTSSLNRDSKDDFNERTQSEEQHSEPSKGSQKALPQTRLKVKAKKRYSVESIETLKIEPSSGKHESNPSSAK